MRFAEYCLLRDAQSAPVIDEAFWDKLTSTFGQSYSKAKGSAEESYEKYAPAVQKALGQVAGKAKEYSEKLGVPLPLATALLAAGLTGGASAIPFATILYFAKKPLMTYGGQAFDKAWDTVAGAIGGGANQQQPQQPQDPAQAQQPQQPQAQAQPQQPQAQAQPQQPQQPQQQKKQPRFQMPYPTTTYASMQPLEHMSFSEFVAIMEAESWGDWAGEKIGGAAGWLAGKVVGYGKKIGGAIAGRAREIATYAKNNPREVAKMLFLVGAGAALGAGIGKLTAEIKSMIAHNVHSAVPDADMSAIDQSMGAGGSETYPAAGDYVSNKAAAADAAVQAKVSAVDPALRDAMSAHSAFQTKLDAIDTSGMSKFDFRRAAYEAWMDTHKGLPELAKSSLGSYTAKERMYQLAKDAADQAMKERFR